MFYTSTSKGIVLANGRWAHSSIILYSIHITPKIIMFDTIVSKRIVLANGRMLNHAQMIT